MELGEWQVEQKLQRRQWGGEELGLEGSRWKRLGRAEPQKELPCRVLQGGKDGKDTLERPGGRLVHRPGQGDREARKEARESSKGSVVAPEGTGH